MSAFYPEIVLAWQGKEYTAQPSFRMVQDIERSGVSIMGCIQRMAGGEPPVSQIAVIVSHLLCSAGARKATPEALYEHLMAHADVEEFQRIAGAITTAFIPVREEQRGNPPSPTDGAKTPESPPTSSGANTTKSPSDT